MANAGAPLAQNHVVVWESPDPQKLFGYTPGLARLDDGRLVATCDLAGDLLKDAPGPVFKGAWRPVQGQVYTSDDRGRTWRHRERFPFFHARPFVAGRSLYVLGQADDLMIMRLDDRGETWSPSMKLTDGQAWQQSACNVHYAHGCVYLTMERRVSFQSKSWEVGEFAPVLMRAKIDTDLTRRESWTFASELSFAGALPGAATDPAIDYFGVPFYPVPMPYGSEPAPGRWSAPIGWLESNVVQFVDPDHYWYDPRGCTYHVWARSHTGGTGYAAVAKVIEESPGQGPMTTLLERVPSGKAMLYVPCPGGHMRFHVLYDPPTKLYWLLGTQATDSMTRADRLPADRYNLPNNQRRRLQLHFSKNMIDWCFAGIVTIGPGENASRHYASMVIDGDDLHVLSRSGDLRARTAHDGNLITFHTVRDFRSLVY